MSVLIPLDRIQDSPFQTRQHYDEASIESLAELTSVDEAGVFSTSVEVGHLGHYNVLCDAEHRRAAVFCYHLFFADMAAPLDEAKKELAERADEANERQVDNRTQPASDGSVSDERADAGDIAPGVSAETTEPESAEVPA